VLLLLKPLLTPLRLSFVHMTINLHLFVVIYQTIQGL
jgi:hypothetical protein